MSTLLNGSRFSPKGSRVPTDLLPPAIRYEAARAVIFEDWGDYIRANEFSSSVETPISFAFTATLH
jgi:hypothetical protein